MKSSRISPRLPALLASLFALAALPACNVVQPAQDDPTRYFVLSDPSVAGAPSVPAASATRIGLHSIRLETYLKHREMVVRTGANEIQFKDYRRWAEPLDAAVGRVLRTSLVASSSVSQVLTEPFPFDQQRDYDVSIDVRRCEGAVEGSGFKAEFTALIEISTTGSDPKIVVRKLFEAPAADWDGSNYDHLASLLTADVSALAQEVASSIPPKS
jgi:uncharacterized lipoprotein YmbA